VTGYTIPENMSKIRQKKPGFRRFYVEYGGRGLEGDILEPLNIWLYRVSRKLSLFRRGGIRLALYRVKEIMICH